MKINLPRVIIFQFLFVIPLLLLPGLFFINDTILIGLKLIEVALLTVFILFTLSFKDIYLFVYILLLYFINIFSTIVNDRSVDELFTLAVVLFPLGMLVSKFKFPLSKLKYYIKPVSYFYISIFIVSSLAVLYFPKEYFADHFTWFFLEKGPHGSSYSLLALYSFILLAYFIGSIGGKIFLFSSILFVFLIIGYDVRTVQLLLLVCFMYLVLKKLDYTIFYISIFLLVLLVISLTGYFYLVLNSEIKNFDYNNFSNGRLFVWSERIQIFSDYSFTTIFFGGGFGADIIATTQWWWVAKASHNDFISSAFNGGLASLFLYFLILFRLSSNHLFLNLPLIAIFISSMLSTGLLMRPFPLVLLLFVFMLYRNYHNDNVVVRKY
jgi:hypothetical protein